MPEVVNAPEETISILLSLHLEIFPINHQRRGKSRVNWLLSGSLCNCSLQISQACDFDMLYFAASFLNDNPSRWSFKRAIVLKKCGLIEKYFVHALQKYRIDLPLFVFLITEVVV